MAHQDETIYLPNNKTSQSINKCIWSENVSMYDVFCKQSSEHETNHHLGNDNDNENKFIAKVEQQLHWTYISSIKSTLYEAEK